ncbi:MAG: hypothetical protein II797_01390 [Clostridia bacterium]|nr:hypothetical protein [Clostridia bacterium]
MYCIRCGVKLQDGAGECPLCGTRIPDEYLIGERKAPANFSTRYPDQTDNRLKIFILSLTTAILVAGSLACLILCLNLYHRAFWSSIVMFSSLLAWILAGLPFLFRKPNPVILVSIDVCAVCGYLLFMDLYVGGRWFLSFAFPVTMIAGAILVAAISCYRYIRGGKLFITGGLFIAIGGYFMLVDMFQHITFGTPVFSWSLVALCPFAAIGLFLIISGIIRPFRALLEKKFFY